MTWVDDLVPPSEDRFPVLSRVCSAPISDAGRRVNLGAVDQSCVGLVYFALSRPLGRSLVFQFPRGRNEVAILLGCVIQLMKLAHRVTDNASDTSFDGPVVVVGTDTLVHERLGRIRIRNQPTQSGLAAGRIRSDGSIVDSERNLSEIAPDGLLYLNTRVGWPPLLRGGKAGAVIIDRSTFSSPAILDLALAWAKRHHARHVIVVAEIGDEGTVAQVREALGREPCVWPWTTEMISDCLATLGVREDTSTLSTNELQGVTRPLAVVRPSSVEIEGPSKRIRTALGRASRIDSEMPVSLQTARRLYFGLIQLPGQLETFNTHAALDHRTSALSSLLRRIENDGEPHVNAAWRSYYMGRWTDLRLDLLELYRLVEQSNPKFLGVGLAIESIRNQDSEAPICIRVPSESAGMALADDMESLVPEWPVDGVSIDWQPWGKRQEWTTEERFEILPAAPPPSRAGLLWSAEASQQVLVLYDFELTSVARRMEQSNEYSIQRLGRARDVLGIGHLPSLTSTVRVDEVVKFDTTGPQAKPLVDLDVDLDVMFYDPEDTGGAGSEEAGSEADPALVTPIVLEPDGGQWLIQHDAQVETLRASKVVYLPVDSIKPGMTVIVPRGDGREELFARLVTATHESHELQAFDVLFTRWRQACWTAYRASGSWEALGSRMAAEGCSVTYQSPRTWATGAVIGPEDPEDIRRIGKLAGDPLVEKQYRRINATVRQVRSLHMRLGSLLSAAMSDVVSGGGGNLEKLQQLLGGIDPSELLDEFELRTVRSVAEPTEVRSHLVRQVVNP